MPRLKIETVPLTDLTEHPRNPRYGDVGAITESLETFGQYAPIVVQKSSGHVIAGNHRLKAARALGWKDIQIVRVDVDDATAERILVADNRMSDIASNDDPVLVELLSELAVDGRLIGTGYDGDDLDALIRELSGDWDAAQAATDEWKGMPEFEQEDVGSVQRIIVHFAFDPA